MRRSHQNARRSLAENVCGWSGLEAERRAFALQLSDGAMGNAAPAKDLLWGKLGSVLLNLFVYWDKIEIQIFFSVKSSHFLNVDSWLNKNKQMSAEFNKHTCGLDSAYEWLVALVIFPRGHCWIRPNIQAKSMKSHTAFREEMTEVKNCLSWDSVNVYVTENQSYSYRCFPIVGMFLTSVMRST